MRVVAWSRYRRRRIARSLCLLYLQGSMSRPRVAGPRALARAAGSLLGPSALCALVSCALLEGCRTPIPNVNPTPSRRGATAPAATPEWVRAPFSWEKLTSIEAWLEEGSAGSDPGLLTEARLQLSEGRLEFSRRDLEGASAPSDALRLRIEAAREGFEQVLADPKASPGQQMRARYGVDAAQALLDVPPRQGLAIISREAWHAEPARSGEMSALRGQWSRITVHHSAESADESQGGALADTAATVQRIQKVHMDHGNPDFGWADIGYHFLIDSSGRILQGRGLEWQGAHARGANNHQNLGLCLLGDFLRHPPSPAALKSLELLLDDLRESYRIPPSRVFAHKELTATVCPGPTLTAWIVRYRRADGPKP